MSNDNYNPENDEYLNKLVKFKQKRNELIEINNIVDSLKEELPPDKIRKIKPVWNWKLISGLLISFVAVVALIFIILPKSEPQGTGLGENEPENVSVKTLANDTANFSFYILNNVGKGKHFNLSYGHYTKLKDMLPDSTIYKSTFITQNGNSTEIFDNKDSLISRLYNQIIYGGDMDFEGFESMFKDFKEIRDQNINSNLIVLGYFPTLKRVKLNILDTCFECNHTQILYFVESENKIPSHQRKFVKELGSNYKFIQEFIQ